MKYYYLPFEPAAKVNYLYLLSLYDVAEYRIETKAFDTICFSSITALAEQVKISSPTISRLLNSDNYKSFFVFDREQKCITLQNSFINGTKRAFVRLTAAEVKLIREVNDNLFAKYLIYLKYYCGYTNNKTDFTAKQFLTACGYSIKSGDYISKVSGFNTLLLDKGIIRIDRYTDELGHTRNKYAFI